MKARGRGAAQGLLLAPLALVVAVALVLTACGGGGGSAPQPQESASDGRTLDAASFVRDQGWTEVRQVTDVTLGAASDGVQLDAFALNVSNSNEENGIAYSVNLVGVGWQQEQRNGLKIGSDDGTHQIAAVRIYLTGAAADECDLWYRAWVSGSGWLPWVSNGEEAGSQNAESGLSAVQVRLVEKGAASPEDDASASDAQAGGTELSILTDEAEIAAETVETVLGLRPLLSGDPTLDSYTEAIVAANGVDAEGTLYNIYEYLATYSYVKENEYPQGDWEEWSVAYAKEMYENGCGNCYRYASLLCWSARRLGYDARVISGEVPWQGVLSPHGWVEITLDGQLYVCDSDLHKFVPGRNFFMVTYEEAPIEYHKI